MSLAVLSHLTHPSPDVPEVKMESKLKALVLVAPWVSFKTDWPSAKRNQYKDIVVPAAGKMWSSDYLGGRPTSPYAEALEAPASWWEGAKVEQLLCVAGSDEILIDPINKWVEKYKVCSTIGKLFIQPQQKVFCIGKESDFFLTLQFGVNCFFFY
jgi:hypothetical protein